MRFFKDLYKYFDYLIFATRSQLKAEVTNSYLDWIWWVLEPFCNMIIYTIIFGYVFNAAEEHFMLFIFIGITMWNFFARTLNGSVKIVKANKGIISKVYIPKHMLLIKLMFINAFKMFVSLGLVFVMLFVYRIRVSGYVFLFIPILMVLFIITYGMACFLVHYGVYIEDLANVVSIVLTMVMYFTGIFYSISKRFPEPYGEIFLKYNPVAFLIDATRNVILYASSISVVELLVWFGFSIIIAAIGTKLIYQKENNYVKVI